MLIKELAQTVVKIKDAQKATAFLHAILTPAELEQIAQRLQIFRLLIKGVPQREISKQLGVSIGTITHGSRELKYGSAREIEAILK
ncbi:transcriptional regulator [Candidatus Peregrinibacteria bacterium CG11_big_fil_rev_8_21_14_0_20_46_8]|nr:MAG: transcriptional regulator [Candidatus Peregrinibacteria bacterium CG11_big_fil_rev_8_21_14_0_20_46_8]